MPGHWFWRRIAAPVAIFLIAGCGDVADQRGNIIYETAKPEPSEVAARRAFHKSLFIVDLHADTMLWDRRFLRGVDYGHVDLPRLIAGNVAIQVFAMVTKTPTKGTAPKGANILHKDTKQYGKRGGCVRRNSFNTTGLLHFVQMRPPKTWFDLEERAIYQAKLLLEFAAKSKKRHDFYKTEPYLMIIKTAADLRELVRLRRDGVPVVGAIIALEGAHWIGHGAFNKDSIWAAVGRLYEAGFRMVAPTHRFGNDLAGSSEGCNHEAPLTKAGEEFLKSAESAEPGTNLKGMILDLAHASDKTVEKATEGREGRPIVLSHSGVRKTCMPATENGPWRCDVDRGTPDELIRAVARTGGIIGIGLWPEAVRRGMKNIAKAFVGAYDALNTRKFRQEMPKAYDPFDHIALGSDFDGMVETPFDVSRLIELTTVLANYRRGGKRVFNDAALRKIFGANACRVFALRLSGGGPALAAEICD